MDMCLRMARTLTKIGKPQQSGEDNFMAINILLNSKSKVLLFMLYVHHRLTVALPALFSLDPCSSVVAGNIQIHADLHSCFTDTSGLG